MPGGIPSKRPGGLAGIRSASTGVMVGIMSGEKRSLLIEDTAVLLGVSRRTVYYRIRQGRLDTMRTLCGSQRVLLVSIERLLRLERGLPLGAAHAGEAGSTGGRAATVRAVAV